ncbi:MAG: alpha/beta fold hydrolase [Acidobacteriota bacterium]
MVAELQAPGVRGPSPSLERARRDGLLASCGHDFEPRFAELEHGRLAHVDEGTGPLVLFVHGNPTWSFQFRHLVQGLKGTHRCVAPDHFGCGFSDQPGEPDYRYTLEQRVADLGALVESLDHDGPVSLVLHDWGGMIGLAWALLHLPPERLDKVVLLNTAGFCLPEGQGLPSSLRLARGSRVGEALVRGLNAFTQGTVAGLGSATPLSAAIKRCYLAPHDSWQRRLSVARFVQDIPLAPGDPAWSLVAEVEAALPLLQERQVLIGWGLQDFVFDAGFLAEWRRRLPDARYEVFEDAGHLVLEDRGETLIPRIVDFLK